jgi:hypothetical protein
VAVAMHPVTGNCIWKTRPPWYNKVPRDVGKCIFSCGLWCLITALENVIRFDIAVLHPTDKPTLAIHHEFEGIRYDKMPLVGTTDWLVFLVYDMYTGGNSVDPQTGTQLPSHRPGLTTKDIAIHDRHHASTIVAMRRKDGKAQVYSIQGLKGFVQTVHILDTDSGLMAISCCAGVIQIINMVFGIVVGTFDKIALLSSHYHITNATTKKDILCSIDTYKENEQHLFVDTMLLHLHSPKLTTDMYRSPHATIVGTTYAFIAGIIIPVHM